MYKIEIKNQLKSKSDPICFEIEEEKIQNIYEILDDILIANDISIIAVQHRTI